MFNNCTSLENVDMHLFNIPSTANVYNMLYNTKANAKFKVKNQDVIDLISPTANNGIVFEIGN